MVDTSAIDAFLGEALWAVRAGYAAPWPQSPANAWNSSEELTAIWERIEFHGISLMLHEQSALLTDWPQKMQQRIAEEARLIGLWEMTHKAALAKLLEALHTAGIEAVLMKGTAIAYSLHDDPATRRRGDSDLLVRSKDRERTRDVLKAAGWHRNKDPHGLIFQEGWRNSDAGGHFSHFLDLHWEPSDRTVLQKVITSEDYFANRRPLPRLSQSAMRADHVLTLVHETLNQKWHLVRGYLAEQGRVTGSRRLVWSVDFALLSQALTEDDWVRLEAFCGERGVGPLVAEALRCAAKDLHLSMPDDILDRLAAMPLDPGITAYFEVNDNLREFWIDLRGARNWSDRITMLKERGLPPRSHLLEKYPDHASWPTALLQARSLAGTAGRLLRRIIK